jgi:hypothetical protein
MPDGHGLSVSIIVLFTKLNQLREHVERETGEWAAVKHSRSEFGVSNLAGPFSSSVIIVQPDNFMKMLLHIFHV